MSLLSRVMAMPVWQQWRSLLLLGVLVVGFLSFDVYRSYLRETEFAQRHNENIARVLDQHLNATFSKIDVALVAAVDGLQPQWRAGQTAQFSQRLHDMLQQMPESQSLRIVNAQGNVVFDASGTPPSGSIADRDYFQRNQNDPHAGLVISGPIYARFTQNWVVTLSRQFRDERGNFMGLIQAAVRSDYFEQFFQTLDMGESGLIALMHQDLSLFVRSPAAPGSMGKPLVNATAAPLLAAGQTRGHFLSRSTADQIQRWHYFYRASHYPFVYVVGTSAAEVFAELRWKAMIYAAFVSILLLAVVQMVRGWRHRHRDAQALAEQMTEQLRLTNQTLEESQTRLLAAVDERRHLIQNLPVGVYKFRVKSDGKLVFDYVSPLWCEQLGLSREAVMEDAGKALAAVLPEDRKEFQARHLAARQSLEQFCWQGRVQRGDEIRWLELKSTATRDVNGDWLWNGVQVDITEQKAAEARLVAAEQAAQAASLAKSQFLANTSHEIRTPMNGVLGMLQLLSHTVLDEQQKDYVGTARECARGLQVVLNDILDLSKVEAGRMVLEPQPFELRPCLAELMAPFVHAAQQKQIDLQLHVADELPAWILEDAVRLRQILVNLLGNAVKFTEQGRVCLTVSVLPDARMELEVRDSGIGMDDAALGRLFSPFTQADGSMTRRFGGTGLGLAITRRLVELMGGQIQVTSGLAQGSVFTVRLPLVAVPAPAFPTAVVADDLPPDHADAGKVQDARPPQGLALGSTPVFQAETMLRLLGDSEELARDIAPSFLEDLQVQRQSLRGAIAQGDFEVARRVAHTLKGLAGQMGGLRLQQVMQQLERLLAQRQVPEAELLQQGEDEADALIAALQAW